MFKDKLKELREKEGLSQQELADKLFVSRSAVAKWENGNGIPSDVNLDAICELSEEVPCLKLAASAENNCGARFRRLSDSSLRHQQ